MTRIAINSDVHSDVHALTDALFQAERLGCDAIVCAGDLVDHGMYPNEALALLSSRSISCIRGNHDR
jgi:predicted phosphodiesterase